jgi:hypothetical protein
MKQSLDNYYKCYYEECDKSFVICEAIISNIARVLKYRYGSLKGEIYIYINLWTSAKYEHNICVIETLKSFI